MQRFREVNKKKENQFFKLLCTLLETNYELEEYMLTGSYATGKNKQDSDIDIIALSKNVNAIHLVNTIYNSKRVQLILFPFHKTHWLYLQYIDNNPVYCSMIKQGVIIKENKFRILSQIKKNVPFHNDTIDRNLLLARGRISSLMQELDCSNSQIENTFIAFELFRLIGSVLTSGYNQDSKHIGRLLSSYSNYSSDILKVLEAFIVTKDICVMKAYVKDFLNELGGSIDKFSTSYICQIYEEGNSFVIQLPNHSISQSFIGEIVTGIKNVLANKSIQILGLSNNQYLEKGIYMLVDVQNEQEWEEIYAKTNNYFKLKSSLIIKKDIRLSFPYQTVVNSGIIFGGKSNLARLTPHFVSLSDYVWEERFSKGLNTDTFAYIASYIIYKNISEDLLLLKKIIDFQFNFYLLEGSDPNNIYNDNQLDKIRIEIIDYYEGYYLSQKEFLANIATNFSAKDYCFGPFENSVNKLALLLNILRQKGTKYPELMLIGIDNDIRLYHSTIDYIFNLFHLQSDQKLSIIFFIKKEFEKVI